MARVFSTLGGESASVRRPSDEFVLAALRQLDDEWSIGVRPRFGGADPDFIAVHRDFGVCAITVKGWTSGPFRQAWNGAIEVRVKDRWYATREAPRTEALHNRNAIFEHFFGGHNQPHSVDIARAIVVLPQYGTAQACTLLRRPHMVSDENWIDVWGGPEFSANPAWALTGDPRMRPKAVPHGCFENLLHHVHLDPELQAA